MPTDHALRTSQNRVHSPQPSALTVLHVAGLQHTGQVIISLLKQWDQVSWANGWSTQTDLIHGEVQQPHSQIPLGMEDL